MNKLLTSAMIFGLAAFCAVGAEKPLLTHGDFKKLTDIPEAKQKSSLLSPKFPWGWGGNNASVDAQKDGNRILLKNVIWSWAGFPQVALPQKIKGEITAMGSGELRIAFSTCVRKPGDKKPFGHEKRTDAVKIKLTDKMTAYPFQYEVAPYEQGYFYIYATNATIGKVVMNVTDQK